MPVIKRYPNRKLYDTEAKRYVTLDGIADMIRKEKEIQVVDNATGEDLTALTLTQIILDQEKKQSGFLPRSVLATLIRAGGDRFSAFQRTLASSIGWWHQVDEEIKRRIQLLVQQGEFSEGEGLSLIEKLVSWNLRALDEISSQPNELEIDPEQLERYLRERQVPTREDLQAILRQLEELAAKLEDISPSGT